MNKHLLTLMGLLLFSTLAGAQSRDEGKVQTALRFLQSQSKTMGLSTDDIAEFKLSSESFSKKSGVTHLYFIQTYKGVEVYNAIVNVHIGKDGRVINHGNRSIPEIAKKVVATKAGSQISPEAAVAAAAKVLGYDFKSRLIPVKQEKGADKGIVRFEGGKLSASEIPVKAMYQLCDDGSVRLAWDLSIQEPSGDNWWSVRVDASNGKLLNKTNWMLTCNFGEPGHEHCTHEDHAAEKHTPKEAAPNKFLYPLTLAGSYNVYAAPIESPNHGSRSIVSNPEDPTASPFGWHDTNGAAGAEFTITRGNNVYAQLDDDGNTSTFGYAPDGGPSLTFDYPADLTMQPDTYIDAVITNLFYWNNKIHDFAYAYGFDEVSGNFQVNNYGRGGLGSDEVIAGAQDASGFNNAHFGTPGDGARPVMRMKLWNATSPWRDGDFESGIMAHEYGHGISNRFTGGPANAGCLGNNEQMGEGWSDYYGLMITMKPGDLGTTGRGIGTYVLGQPTTGLGIRARRYSTDLGINEFTYDNIKTAAIPHGVGHVWATMLWEMTWGIIDAHGQTAGFDIAMNLVNEGMKLQPCGPGFVDGRDAILAADATLYGGANQCIIWTAFAKRGLGYSASQGSANSATDGTQAFDMPPSYIVKPSTASLEVCQGVNAVYDISVTSCAGSSVATLSASGLPMGAIAIFSPNPVTVPNANSTLTISNLTVPGNYTITITATGSLGTSSETVNLRVINATLDPPALVVPIPGAVNVFTTPLFDWVAVVDAETSSIQVATDAGFSNIVASANNLTATNYGLQTPLNSLTTYYWRVQAENACGGATWSSVRSFMTGNFSCTTIASTNVPVEITTATPVTVTSTINFSDCGSIGDINVTNLGISHTNTDEVRVTLTSPFGTTITLLDRECNLFTANILINLDDQAENTNYPCPPTDNGYYQPRQALSAFNGENPLGIWTLSVIDLEPGDGGSVNSWSLGICYTPNEGTPITCYRDADGDGFGNQTPRTYCGTCGDGYVSNDDDCDDNDNAIRPGSVELCDFIDNNCNSVVDEGFDQDGDGFTTCGGDCDDTNANTYPGAAELCDNIDNNCDGAIDNFAIASTDVPVAISASGTPAITSTLTIAGVSGNLTDINVRNLNITHSWVGDLTATLTAPDGVTTITLFNRPGAPASGNGCGGNNLAVSFDDAAMLTAANFESTCGNAPAIAGIFQPVNALSAFNGSSPNGIWTLTISDAANFDGGSLDNWSLEIATDAVVGGTYYPDNDGDGYGANIPTTITCENPIGYVTNNLDCNDNDAAINPTTVWYKDADNDGYSDGATLAQCTQPAGYKLPSNLTALSGDCNDNNAAVHPGAPEICDGIDNNCNGQTDEPQPISAPWTSSNVGTGANGTSNVGCASGSTVFNLSAQGFSTPTADVAHSVWQQLCGNSSITVRVNSLSGGGWAGIAMRESSATGSRLVSMKTQLNNIGRREVRSVTNGGKVITNFSSLGVQQWLRITRVGNVFEFYFSADGTNWQFRGTQTLALNQCLQVGMFAESINANATTNVAFSNVVVTGTPPVLPLVANNSGLPPTASAEILRPDVRLYPNPSSGEVNIDLSQFAEPNGVLKVFNLLGELVLLENLNGDPVHRTTLSGSAGIYLIVIEVENAAPVVKRIVLDHSGR